MAKVCIIAILFFLLTKNDIYVHYNKFPNLGVYHINFPNLKGHRASSQNAKKKLACKSPEWQLPYIVFLSEFQKDIRKLILIVYDYSKN